MSPRVQDKLTKGLSKTVTLCLIAVIVVGIVTASMTNPTHILGGILSIVSGLSLGLLARS